MMRNWHRVSLTFAYVRGFPRVTRTLRMKERLLGPRITVSNNSSTIQDGGRYERASSPTFKRNR